MVPKKLRHIVRKLRANNPRLTALDIKSLFDRSRLSRAEKPSLTAIMDAITQEEFEAEHHDFTGVQNPDQKDQSCPTGEIVPTSRGKCPRCGSIEPLKLQSTAIRPRKTCQKCGKKAELKFWKIPGTDQKDQSRPAGEIVPIQHRKMVLTPNEQKIRDLIAEGYFASTIAQKLNLSAASVSRIIKKLVQLHVLIPIPSYPKTYKVMDTTDPPQYKTPPVGKWPTTTTIHCIRFKVPMQVRGNVSGGHPFNMRTWVGYIFYHHDWKIQVNTRIVVFNYTPKLRDVPHAMEALDALKQTLPLEFLTRRGFVLDPTGIDFVQPPHAQTNFGHPALDTCSKPIKVYNSDGSVKYWQDHSDENYEDGPEQTPQAVDPLLDVPKQVQQIQQQIAQLPTQILQQILQVVQALIPKSSSSPQTSPVPTTPVPNIYQ